jgi:hypothetical protein
MIKKNDCVPKKVLNERKLRRHAIAVMVGGLVVAFLFGLIVGWFIPKNDKKNVTASAAETKKTYSTSLPLTLPFSLNNLTYVFLHGLTISVEISTNSNAVTMFSVVFNGGYDDVTVPVSPTEPSSSNFYVQAFNVETSLFNRQPFRIWSDTQLNVSPDSSLVRVKVSYILSSSGYLGWFFTFTLTDKTVTVSLKPPNGSIPVPVSTIASEYVIPFTSTSYDEGYNAGYSSGQNDGYNSGYNSGFSEGQDQGYTTGFEAGKGAGYNSGYTAGIAAGSNNNFMSLIVAVVDAPIKAFSSLFNFDILGFNMKTFVLSILTAALIVAIMRFFMGKIH